MSESTCVYCNDRECANASRNLIIVPKDEWGECCFDSVETGPLSYEEMEDVRLRNGGFDIEEYQDEDGYDCIAQTLPGSDHRIFWTYHPFSGGWEAFADDDDMPFWRKKYWPEAEDFAAAWEYLMKKKAQEVSNAD